MLGEKLRNARKSTGMSQEELALEADVDRTHISDLENNKKSPSVDLLFRLCDAMEVKASALLAEVEKDR